MALRPIRRNFSGGEMAPEILGRDDLEKYATACYTMQNFTAQLLGGARYRSGFRFVGEALGEAVLIPFQFNTDEEDTYQLVFTNLKMEIVQDDGFVIDGIERVVIDTPFTSDQLTRIRVAQIGDVVYIAHPDHAPQKLTRTSHTGWTLETIVFASTISPPISGAAVFWNGEVGTYTQRYKVTSIKDTGEESVPSGPFEITNAKHPGYWIEDNYASLSWDGIADAVEYNVYKEEAGVYNLIGTATEETPAFLDDNYTGDAAITPPIQGDPFAGGNNPAEITLHQQRIWYGGSNDKPQTFYASQTGLYENFDTSEPTKDDDSLEFTLSSGKINQIKWMAAFGDLLIGTTGTEFQVTSTGASITPVDVDAPPQSYWGSGPLPPIIVGNSVVHTQRQGSAVRDLFYSLEKDGYAGNDLSVLASHLFDGYSLVSWAYQQTPDSVLWAVRSDGALLGMTYLKEHQIWGWHRHTTDGEFKAVSVVGGDNEDRLYAVVKRTINTAAKYYIEKMESKWRLSEGIENAFFVDSGLTYSGAATTTISGLDHLEGKTVSALINGSPVRDLTVVSGDVELPQEGTYVTVGLPYVGVLAPMPFTLETKEGTRQGLPKGFGKIYLRVKESIGGSVGVDDCATDIEDVQLDDLTNLAEYWGDALTPISGLIDTEPPGGFGPDHTLFFVKKNPTPFTLQSLIAEVDFG